MIILLIYNLFHLWGNFLTAEEFCKVNNIFKLDQVNIKCKSNNLLFGEFSFTAKDIDTNYILNKKYNLQILANYEKRIISYIDKYCKNNNSLRIKDIINYDKNNNLYNTKIIISCRFKNGK
ncbi:MAG: hypothetical protein CMM96_04770 [Rickettsiales bacterium]|nr:hypothetical protein [Rickettsiales bacterium]